MEVKRRFSAEKRGESFSGNMGTYYDNYSETNYMKNRK